MQNDTLAISTYLTALEKELERGTEHTHRPALKTLIETISTGVTATNEPKRIACGAPDYVVTKHNVPLGYIEAKDIGVNLDEVEKGEQMERYYGLGNVVLTDYLEFRFYLNGKRYETVRLAAVQNKKLNVDEKAFQKFALLLREYTQNRAVTIQTAQDLATMMSDKARLMREIIFRALTDPSQSDSPLHDQLKAFRTVLIHDMDETQFADIYAQTIAYGLFVARFHDDSVENFTRKEAEDLVPKSNPFLRKLFHHIAGPDLDVRISWIVDALADVFAHSDVSKIMSKFGNATKREDPIIHFYETFLAHYNPKLRKSRGVYYTPEPVVSFIVRSVNALLKSEFGLADGLRNTSKATITSRGQGRTRREQQRKVEVHKVQILDPAAGTGTFLNEIIKHLYKQFEGQQGMWGGYVDDHLLPRLHGFELLMAPYTMCHLKLGLTLKQTGYKEGDKRLSVYLTNSLEEGHEDYETLFASWLSQESNEASRIKNEMPIMVVLGNPPYSVSSANKGDWIQKLIEDYKAGLNERKINLDDDYIKFLRFAQWHIERTGQGIVAMITNNSYIDGITHRRMREKLLETFDKIFIFDLHGDAKEREKSAEGDNDQNVFDIQQGVCIGIFVKTSTAKKKNAKIFHADIVGKQQAKYERLWNEDIGKTPWKEIEPIAPNFFFVPKNLEAQKDYAQLVPITAIFELYNSGIQTKRDALCIQRTKKDMEATYKEVTTGNEQELRKKYELPEDGRDWRLSWAIDDAKNSNPKMVQMLYRPFDYRWTLYTGKSKGFLAYPRAQVMDHMLAGVNVGLITNRQIVGEVWSYAGVTEHINCHGTFYLGNKGQDYLFPLYLYEESGQTGMFADAARKPNFNADTLKEIEGRLSMKYSEDQKEKAKGTFGPEHLFNYIYAVLNSPAYRERYKEHLKIDFPRIPFTKNEKLFWELCDAGAALRELHLMHAPQLAKLITSYPVEGSNVVERYEFEGKDTGKVWINATQCFDKVPRAAWEFEYGGYKPAQKWLKDRKGRTLTSDDLMHYQKMIVVFVETMKVMEKIDEAIEKAGGWAKAMH